MRAEALITLTVMIAVGFILFSTENLLLYVGAAAVGVLPVTYWKNLAHVFFDFQLTRLRLRLLPLVLTALFLVLFAFGQLTLFNCAVLLVINAIPTLWTLWIALRYPDIVVQRREAIRKFLALNSSGNK